MKKYELLINGKRYEVEIRSLDNGMATVVVNGSTYRVEVLGEEVERITRQAGESAPGPASEPAVQPKPVATPKPAPAPRQATVSRPAPMPSPAEAPSPAERGTAPAAVKVSPGDVTAPMPGLILEVKVSEGDMVRMGDVVVRMEAMKMENDILATRDGAVSKVHVEKGAEVQGGQVLVTIGD